MKTKHCLQMLGAALAWFWLPSPASAQATVECMSHNYQYNECYAPLRAPQLVNQESHASCIVNRTWGFNSKTRRIWVSDGCSGVFADPGGYHHGQAGTFDKGARTYGPRGHDAGVLVAGAVLGAVIAGAGKSDKKRHTTTNSYYYTRNSGSGYTGCHGVGCLVDDPDQKVVDDRPQYDKEGNPNFDTHGNYQGCHGIGCEVDTPDSDSDSSDDPPEPGQTEFSDSDDSGSDDSGGDDSDSDD